MSRFSNGIGKVGAISFIFAALFAFASPGAGASSETPASAAPAPASAPAQDESHSPTAHVKYRAAKDVNFEDLLVRGELKRPEVMVVTGNESQGTDGLLRLREDFLDRMADDFGESQP